MNCCSLGFLLQCSDLSSRTPPRRCWISCLERPPLKLPLLSDGWVIGPLLVSHHLSFEEMYRIKVSLLLLLQILSCFATLLRKQDASVWTYPSTIQAYHGLLSFAVHSKPKVCLLRPPPLNVRSNDRLSPPLNQKIACLNVHVFPGP